MTVVNASAGVYVAVDDRSQVSAPKKQVSVGAITFLSKKGPVDQIVRITNGSNQFLQMFGSPDTSIGYGHHTVLTSLSRMQEILCTRVHNDARFGGLIVTTLANGKLGLKQFTTAKCVDPIDPNKFYMDASDTDFDAEKDIFYIYGVDPNDYNGDNRIAITSVKDSTDYASPNTFQIQVYGKNSTSSAKPSETWVVSRSIQTDGNGRQQFMEKVVNGKSKTIRVLNNNLNKTVIDASVMESATLQYLSTGSAVLAFLSNGSSGLTDAGSSIPVNKLASIYNGLDSFPAEITNAPSATKNSGWQLYYDREEIEFDLLINGGVTIPSVQRRMVDICAKRGDTFAILDMPYDKQGNKYSPTTDPIEYRNLLNIDSSDAALYTPWYEVDDPFTGQTIAVPPSGHVAAIFCATDIDYATWFAPAGLKRGLLGSVDPNFINTDMIYRQGDRDLLEEAQVNCTRIIQNIGIALWSASTLQRMESALSNINVSRLLKYCTRNISTQLLYNVFDPNNAYLRSEIIQRLTDIFEPIKLASGVYGYNIICAVPGEPNANNTYDDIALGNLNVDIYFNPVIPAKRFMVKLIVNKAGATLGPVTLA